MVEDLLGDRLGAFNQDDADAANKGVEFAAGDWGPAAHFADRGERFRLVAEKPTELNQACEDRFHEICLSR